MTTAELYKFIRQANRPQSVFDIANKFGNEGVELLDRLVAMKQVRAVPHHEITFVAN